MKKIVIILSIIIVTAIVAITAILYINEKNKIDVYVTTNFYAKKVESIATDFDKYENLRISITGYLHYDEYDNCYIVRDYVLSDGKTMVGILLDGEYDSFKEETWVKVVGIIKYKFTDYQKGTRVPYIKIEKIMHVKMQDGDRTVIT